MAPLRREDGTLLILLSLISHLSFLPPWQKRDGVLLPGDYFAFISCGVGRANCRDLVLLEGEM